LEIIYKSNQAAKHRDFGFRIDSVFIKIEMRASLIQRRQGVLKVKEQALVSRDESRECCLDANIDN
jgi:hypothetical protein